MMKCGAVLLLYNNTPSWTLLLEAAAPTRGTETHTTHHTTPHSSRAEYYSLSSETEREERVFAEITTQNIATTSALTLTTNWAIKRDNRKDNIYFYFVQNHHRVNQQ